MMHGVAADPQTSFAIMDRALEAGINFWDTANVSGNDGLTEKVLGSGFTQSKRRDEVVLATRFRFRMGEGPTTWAPRAWRSGRWRPWTRWPPS